MPTTLLLLVLSLVVYQVAQKILPQGLNPWHVLAIVYASSLVLCVLVGLLDSRGKTLLQTLRESNWAVPMLAISVVGIELAWILALRAGWRLSVFGLLGNVSAAMIVALVGVLAFKEKLSLQNMAGMVVSVLGLWLLMGQK